MNCDSNIGKVVECARMAIEPDAALKSHLRVCARCLDRWEGERELANHLRAVRQETASRRSPAFVKQSLLEEFTMRHARAGRMRRYWGFGYAGFATAAALVTGIVAGPGMLSRIHPDAGASVQMAAVQNEPDADGFIAVPYAPPLATGEMVRIVHTELNPAALASLGVSVDPTWTSQLPADVLEGEDGMPRAVRVSETEVGESGS